MPLLNADREDLNADGADDLLFADGLRLQRNGVFPPEDIVPLPDFPSPGWLDADGQRLHYLGLRDGAASRPCVYQRYALIDGNWQQEERRELADAPCGEAGELRLMPFIRNGHAHYFSGGDLVTVPLTGGEEIRVSGLAPKAVALLDRSQPLWPASARNALVVDQGLRARLVFQDAGPELWSWTPLRSGVEISRRWWREGGGEEVLELSSDEQAALINADDQLDRVTWAPEQQRLAGITVPGMKLTIALAGSEVLFEAPAHAPGGACPPPRIRDVNGDGLLDVVLFSLMPGQAGARELALQLLTRAAIICEVRIYLQDPDVGFHAQPSLRRELEVELDAPPVQPGNRMADLGAGGLLSMDGDLDGDGWCDLLSHARMHHYDCYRVTAAGIEGSPSESREIPVEVRIYPANLDGNSRADVVLLKPGEAGSTEVVLR